MKKLLTDPRIVILILVLILALVAIYPRFDTSGVAIRSVADNSAASSAIPLPVPNPESGISPISREIIKTINNKPINSPLEYYDFMAGVPADTIITIDTTKGTYRVTTRPILETGYLNETELQNVTTEVFDPQTNTTENVTTLVEVNKTFEIVLGVEDIGIVVMDVPTTNIRRGLDLAGGTRVVLQPQEPVTDEDMDIILETIRQRLNVFGVSDVVVRSVQDFTGEVYVLVEVAGVSQQEITELLSEQGKFEAKIGDETVFSGGEDVVYVCRTSTCSGIDPQYGCQQLGGEWVCAFRFSISLSQQAAQRQAAVTAELPVVFDGGEGRLSENLSFFLDNELVNELFVSANLKGNAMTEISITGSGSGTTQTLAAEAALDEMRRLQTVLITGSLPVELEIIQSDTISPTLGESFVNNALLVGLLALGSVVLVVAFRYRKPIIAIPIIVTMASEVLLLLGFAALIGWRLDLAAIAGIIIAVGTGVDDQIVIVDETLSRKKKEDEESSWANKIKKAFFIIMTAYFTTVVAMLPLWFSGAGLLKGFALTTIVGVSIGVLITRPAFAKILEYIVAKQKK